VSEVPEVEGAGADGIDRATDRGYVAIHGRVVEGLAMPTPVRTRGQGRVRDLPDGQRQLSRRGVVYAAGTARLAHGRMSLRLLPVRRLRPGKYTLTLVSGTGRHKKISRQSFTLP
jgi:hypothetical protein